MTDFTEKEALCIGALPGIHEDLSGYASANLSRGEVLDILEVIWKNPASRHLSSRCTTGSLRGNIMMIAGRIEAGWEDHRHVIPFWQRLRAATTDVDAWGVVVDMANSLLLHGPLAAGFSAGPDTEENGGKLELQGRGYRSCTGSSPAKGFFSLPREIRDMIYKLALVDSKALVVWSGPSEQRSAPSVSLPLLRTSRAIYNEASEIFYALNEFSFVWRNAWFVLHLFLERIGKRNRQALRNVSVALPDYFRSYTDSCKIWPIVRQTCRLLPPSLVLRLVALERCEQCCWRETMYELLPTMQHIKKVVLDLRKSNRVYYSPTEAQDVGWEVLERPGREYHRISRHYHSTFPTQWRIATN